MDNKDNIIYVTKQQYNKFLDELQKPPRHLPKLKKLLTEESIFERRDALLRIENDEDNT